ncbi:MAG TPA: hypothetical protein VLX92_10960 [Kofleriaceae bacterium]|nr:hypothetical protein [Kofleriaceae bacterium]
MIAVRVAGLVTVQDLGRPGRMHEAIPPGGALAPALLVAANRRCGNPDGSPALEVLGRLVVRADRELAVASDARAWTAAAGEAIELASAPRRVAYLAVRGGIAAPVLLGGRGALVSARLGPIVRTGDELAVGDAPAIAPREVAPWHDAAPLRVLPGPDGDAFAAGALAALGSAPYRVLPASDRVGTRLYGPALARRAGFVERSRPMVRGAIEVPPDGQPIVLGPEHPTTGGYPLIGVVASEDLDRLFATRLGGELRFTIAR